MTSVTYKHPSYTYRYRLDENLHGLYTLIKLEGEVEITSLPINVDDIETFRNRLINTGWIVT
jgi:hypothetical protein